MTSRRSSLRTSFPSLGGSSAALVWFAPFGGKCTTVGLDLVARWSGRECSEQTPGSPTFLGSPTAPMPCSSTPEGLAYQDTTVRKHGLHGQEDEDSAPQAFGAHSHGVGAGYLRFAGWVAPPPRKTRFRLWPTLPGRIGYLLGCYERFQLLSSVTSSSSFPKPRGATCLALV